MGVRPFAIALMLSVIFTAAPAHAEVLYPPALRVGLEPPTDAVPSTRFPGFEDAARHVMITVLDLPMAAYEQLETAVFTNTQQGLQDVKRESFPFESGIGFLVTARGEQNGVKVHKWFLVARAVAGPDLDLATLVTVEVPETARAVYTDAVVRKALASVTFRKPPIEEQVKLLPFSLSEMASFHVMQVLPGGLILTDGPDNNINTQPYMIVGVIPGGTTNASDRARVARDLLNAAPLRELNVTSSEAMRIGGSPGYEIRATANGLDGSAVSLVQWIRFGSTGYLRIIGVSRPDAWDQLFPRFRAVRDGIEPK